MHPPAGHQSQSNPKMDGKILKQILGPLAGLVLASAIVVFSYTVGRLDLSNFVKALVAVGVASAIGAAIVALLSTDRISELSVESADRALAAPVDRLKDQVAALESLTQRRLDDLGRQVDRLAREQFLDDPALAELECGPQTIKVTICRRKMGDEFDRDDEGGRAFRAAVTANLKRNTGYTWITEDNGVSVHRKGVITSLYPDHLNQIDVFLLEPEIWRRLPFSFEVVIYTLRSVDGALHHVAYAEVSFGSGDSHIWRRVGTNTCADWLGVIRPHVSS